MKDHEGHQDDGTGAVEVDITTFCGTVSYKPSWLKPWVQEGYECACDGLTLAFRPTTLPNDHPKIISDLSEVISLALSTECDREFPDLPTQPVCAVCQGTGWSPLCEACEGSGEDECGECGGPTDCTECDGTGEDSSRCTSCVDGYQICDRDGIPLPFLVPGTDLCIEMPVAKRLSDLNAKFCVVPNTTSFPMKSFCVWRAGDLIGVTPAEDISAYGNAATAKPDTTEPNGTSQEDLQNGEKKQTD